MARIRRLIIEIISLLLAATPKPIAKLLRSLLFLLKHRTAARQKSSSDIPQQLAQVKDLVLLIGHSNYLESTGGTERVIISEVEKLLQNERDSIFIYPLGTSNRVRLRKPKKYGVILNGFEVCDVKATELVSFVSKLNISEVRIHHILQWPLKDFIALARSVKLKNIKLLLYVHDFLYSCPKVNSFCKSGTTLCRNSYYIWAIHMWRSLFELVLEMADEISAPSAFMKENLPIKHLNKVSVFSPYNDVTKDNYTKKKIAYLGYASPIKGYDTWLKLVRNALVARTYDFVHLGHRDREISSVPSIPYSFHNTRECIASHLLIQHNVDYVLLWSQVPESFSFTFHEAKTAKKFVLTSKNSGNIAYEINKNKDLGLILDNEYDLVQFLLKNKSERTS